MVSVTHPLEKTEFGRLLDQHARGIHAHIHSLVPHVDDAAEVFQETCTTLWQKYDQYQPGTDFRAWACRIAYYKVLKLRERQARSPRLFSPELLDQLDEELIVMSDVLDRRSEALIACREKLKAGDRDLLDRYYREGATTRRVAAHLKWSTHKLYRSIRRIHSLLLECINRTLSEDANG